MKNDWPAILKESVKDESSSLLANLRRDLRGEDSSAWDAALENSVRAVTKTLARNEKTLYEKAEDSFLDRWKDEPEKIEEEIVLCLLKIIRGFVEVLKGV